MSSTNTANVIERVLNSKTIFNYLFVTKFPITNVSNGCYGFECDIGTSNATDINRWAPDINDIAIN